MFNMDAKLFILLTYGCLFFITHLTRNPTQQQILALFVSLKRLLMLISKKKKKS